MISEMMRAPDSVMSAPEANNELVQRKYAKALVEATPDVYEEIVDVFNEHIPLTDDWSSVKLPDVVMQAVCRASNRIFVGPDLCRAPEWVDLNIKFTIDALTVATLLRMVPPFLRPLANRLISKIPKRMEAGINHLRPTLEARRKEREVKGDESENPSDMITWLLDLAKGEETTAEALTMRILAINFGAIHTTSLTFTHAFYYLAAFPKFAQGLREEVDEIVKQEGWTKAGLDQMERIDSFIKETQRLSPLGNLVMGRLLLQDYTFYDGTTLPSGTAVAASMHSVHFDESTYEDPMTFDPLRFVKFKETNSEGQYGLISSSADSLAFGHGRHACPGRYLAASEMKVMLAYLVSTYDVKLEPEGVRPADLWLMTSCLPNRNAKVFFRKRKVE